MYALEDEPEKGRRWFVLAAGAVVAAALQGGGLYAAERVQPREHPQKPPAQMVLVSFQPKLPPPPVKEEVVESPPEVKKPEVKPKPEVKKPEVKKPKKKKKKPKKKKRPKKKKPQAKAPVKTPKKAAAPVVVGLTLSSTDAKGKGPALQVGNTQMGEMDKTAVAPVLKPAPEGAGKTVVAPEPVPPSPPVRKHARVKKKVRPKYTRAALRADVQGQVVVVAVVGKNGRVKTVDLVKGLGFGLDQAAVEAVMRWTFSPATVDGVPVRSKRRLTIDFVIED